MYYHSSPTESVSRAVVQLRDFLSLLVRLFKGFLCMYDFFGSYKITNISEYNKNISCLPYSHILI